MMMPMMVIMMRVMMVMVKVMMVMMVKVMMVTVLHLCKGGKYNPRVGEIHPTLLQSYSMKN